MFHNGSAYDYHFMIKYLARKFYGQFECLVENTEKYITFSVPIKKVIIDENEDDKESKPKEIKYRISFTDSCRFMQDSLSNLADNLSELKIRKIPNNVLIKRFYNIYQLSDNDINKFKLLLRKSVYTYEYLGSWSKFNDTLLPNKDPFYSKLNLEHISDEDYAHAHEVWNTFNIRNLGEYHDLYVKLDTALLADVFESFRNKCLEIYKLDPAYFLTAPGLAWWACLKKTGIKLELLTDNNMLMMFEKGIRGGMSQATYRYAKANNKHMKNHDMNYDMNYEEFSSFLMYVGANNLYGWAMSKKLPVDNFKWVDDLSMFTEDFIKSYDQESDIGYLLIADIEYPKNLHMLHSALPFLPDRMKINKVNELVCNLNDKENYSIHILALKQTLNHGLKLKRVHSVISVIRNLA